MNENTLVSIEQEGQRVLLTSQLAESYETDAQTITNNFNRNKERYREGKHFYCLEGETLKAFKSTTTQIDLSSNRINKLYLWTERGALLHAKSLNTDRAWEVYDKLVETYFRATALLNGGTAPDRPIKTGKTEAQLAAEAKRADAMLLNAKSRVADRLQKLYDRANVKPKYQALAIGELFAEDGIKLPRIALAGTRITFDKSSIADRLGILSKSGNPLALAVGAIIGDLTIEEEETEEVPFHRNGHDGTDVQYAESVIEKVADWLQRHNSPAEIPGRAGKKYFVRYRDRT